MRIHALAIGIAIVAFSTGCATDVLLGTRTQLDDGSLEERGIDLAFAWGVARTQPTSTEGGQMSEVFEGFWGLTMQAVQGVLGRGDTINQTFEGVAPVDDE